MSIITLRHVVAVSGEPGLFKTLSLNMKGILLESIDDKKRLVLKNLDTSKVMSLADMSVSLFDDSSDVTMDKILASMYSKLSSSVLDVKTLSGEELNSLMNDWVPNYNSDKMKNHEVRKLIGWYNTILSYLPYVLEDIVKNLENKELENKELQNKELENKNLEQKELENKELESPVDNKNEEDKV